jgi:hypothetical protein
MGTMTKRGFEEIMRAAGAAAGKVRHDDMPSLTPTSITVSLDPIELRALEDWSSWNRSKRRAFK